MPGDEEEEEDEEEYDNEVFDDDEVEDDDFEAESEDEDEAVVAEVNADLGLAVGAMQQSAVEEEKREEEQPAASAEVGLAELTEVADEQQVQPAASAEAGPAGLREAADEQLKLGSDELLEVQAPAASATCLAAPAEDAPAAPEVIADICGTFVGHLWEAAEEAKGDREASLAAATEEAVVPRDDAMEDMTQESPSALAHNALLQQDSMVVPHSPLLPDADPTLVSALCKIEEVLPARPMSMPSLSRRDRKTFTQGGPAIKWVHLKSTDKIALSSTDPLTPQGMSLRKSSLQKLEKVTPEMDVAVREVQKFDYQLTQGRVVTEHVASRGASKTIILEAEEGEPVRRISIQPEVEIFEVPVLEVTVEEEEVDLDPMVAGRATSYRKSQLSPTKDKVDSLRWDFEGKETPAQMSQRLRANFTKRRNEVVGEAGRFLEMMREKGGGNVTVAWRRHFDADGDGSLSFKEFCAALSEMKYEVDTVKLWHQFGGGSGSSTLGLEVLDPKGAEILEYFAGWCKECYGGPMEVFALMDADGSDSLEPDELSEGLRDMGFFEVPNILHCLSDEDKVLKNLYPLLDQSGMGCVQAEQMLFLEQDKDKKARNVSEIRNRRDFGQVIGGIETTRDAEKLLGHICMRETQLGGRFWKMIAENNVLPSSPMSSRPTSRVSSPTNRKASPSRKLSPVSPTMLTARSEGPGSPNSTRSPKFKFPPKCFPAGESPKASDSLESATAMMIGASSASPVGGVLNFPATTEPLAAAGVLPLGSFPSGLPSLTSSPNVTGMPHFLQSSGGFQPASLAASAAFTAGFSDTFAAQLSSASGHAGKPKVERGVRLACLASSSSLPQLTFPKPEVTAKLKRDAMKKNNSEIRMRATQKMRGARSIYGGALVTPLPAVNPKEPIVPAKASLILPDFRRPKKGNRAVENFNPRRSMPADFFRSGGSRGLFDHYFQSQALEDW